MSTLKDVINRFRSESINRELWLYIAGNMDNLNLQTPADLGIPESDEVSDAELDPPDFSERGLEVTIDAETVDDCIKFADELAGSADNEAAATVIRYYIRFDAWPESLDAPDPPPAAELILRQNKEFMDLLGPERRKVQCKNKNCGRGAVEGSVFCRRHHFENVKRISFPIEN